jgi:CubicO group peptidase (beta-lactamase class C family)
MFDPISKYLPELANMKVYVSGSGDDMVVEDAKTPIRIIDLFMHTSGFSYGFSNSEVDKLYQKMLSQPDELNRANILTKFAELPLTHQPGTAWNYGVSTDIIGFLIEKLSGKKLNEYMQETIFSPLGMKDTGFYVPADKLSRLTQIYTADKTGQTIVMENEPVGDFMSEPKIHNAGGGLVSTMQDYFTFAQMMLNGGEINGVRILGRKTVNYMSSNHLPKQLIPYNSTSQGEGYGLAMSVTVDPEMAGFMSSKGDFGWGGAASTYFRVDPEEKIVMISMAQFVPIGFHRYHDDFRNLVYQALID